MAWLMMIFGVLASFGLLCAIWTLFGWYFGSGKGGALICLCRQGREISLITRYSQLRAFGLLRCPLLLVGSSLTEREQIILRQRHPGIEFCTLDSLPARLELEANRFD